MIGALELPHCASCNRGPEHYGDCPFCEICKRVERAREELDCAWSALERAAPAYILPQHNR